jgi:hypothetical protein
VRANLLGPDSKKHEALIRVHREHAAGQIQNENKNWESTIKRLKGSDNPDSIKLGVLLNEARLGAMDTLKEGGMELDLSYERNQYRAANNAYKSAADPGSGYRIEAGKPREDLQKLIPEEYQKKVSIYEYIPNVDFQDLSAAEREALAKQILKAESRALFELGSFDPDGHIGNWMIDKEHKRLVRIDYAQMRTPAPETRDIFNNILGRSLVPKLEGEDHRAIAEHMATLFDSTPDVKLVPVEIEAQLKLISRSPKFPPATEPQNRILFIREELESFLQKKHGPAFYLSLKPDFRAALASMGRMLYYKDFMPEGEFIRLITEHMDIPKGRILRQRLTTGLLDSVRKTVSTVVKASNDLNKLRRDCNLLFGALPKSKKPAK